MGSAMLAAPTSRPCPWWLPWLVSIVVHAAVLLGFSLVSGPRHQGQAAIDSRLSHPPVDTEMQLFLVDEPGERVPVLLHQLPQSAAAVPVLPSVAPPNS